ncbi:hypothetical protein [Streptomyces sp. P17]|uniref:NADAR family protein n=1 Tax=Streptomyces sp. P17 TaxID=3074716 RepID=UPI0028F40995|nr:hypothetical protein [Streptomyces sp. P17]MDT9696188.1 hypothetical protein [Streptomyces sp. P17]
MTGGGALHSEPLSAEDPADRDRIRAAATAAEAQEQGGSVARLGVMGGLLRAEFGRHPGLAGVLLSTGDARISYTGFSESPYWTDGRDGRGRNWVGRLLELVRSELPLCRG